MEQKFYICKHCGNIIAKVKDVGVPVVCCGEPMSEIVPGTTDAAVEKHVPVWTVENGIVHVKVGSVEHPMLPEHYIEWVSLQTKQGNQRKELHPGEKPEVCFALCEGDEVEAVYAYCNLHSQAHRRVLPLPQGVHRGNQVYVPGVQESNCRSGLRGVLPLYALLQILAGLREESYAVKETGCHR